MATDMFVVDVKKRIHARQLQGVGPLAAKRRIDLPLMVWGDRRNP